MSSVAKGQLGFIQFVIAPIYTELAAVVPEVKRNSLGDTQAFWRERSNDGASYEDIFGGPPEEAYRQN